MVNTALVYQTKFRKNLHEAYVHLARIDEALDELGKKYRFPIAQEQFADLLTNRSELAFDSQKHRIRLAPSCSRLFCFIRAKTLIARFWIFSMSWKTAYC
jgi:hypothetical protein